MMIDKKKAIKLVCSTCVSSMIIGTSIMGAIAAADLSEYPSQFIADGKFQGLIVVGEMAASSDVVGAIDIATSLQYDAKKTTVLGSNDNVVTTIHSGDAAKVESGIDMLEINETIGDVKAIFTGDDLDALASGSVSNALGATNYNQYLNFKSVTTNFPGRVIYSENENEDVGDYLYFADGTTIFEYELQFEEGFESDVVTGHMVDIEDESLVILGKKFNVVSTSLSGLEVKMTLLGGEVTDTLSESETKTYTINGNDYEVNVLIVSDNNNEVKFVVNGEVTDKLSEGSTDTLSDGTMLGVRDIMPNEGTEEEGGDIVEFYLGASKLELTDTNYESNTWYNGVEVNDESIEDASIIIDMTNITTTKKEINSIKYRLHADSKMGDVFIEAGHGIKEYLDEPEGMLNADWDIMYDGLSEPIKLPMQIISNGDDSYDLLFPTQGHEMYKIPFIDNSNDDDHGFKYGDNDNDLQFIEAPSLSTDYVNSGFWITEDDYFILGDSGNLISTITKVLRYDSIDTSNREIQFTDLAGGQFEVTYGTDTLTQDTNTATGILNTAGRSYTVWVSNITGNPIAIDLDHSSSIDGGEATIVTPGILFDLGGYSNASFSGDNMELVEDSIITTFLIPSFAFDESTHPTEYVFVNLTESGTNQVDLSIVSAMSNIEMHTLDDLDLERGMTEFGVLYEKTDSSSPTDADDLALTLVLNQLEAQVFVTFGDSITTTETAIPGSPIGSEMIERIDIGAAVLDKEVKDLWAQNLIIIGGPCANLVAQEVMGVTLEKCAEDFESGKAKVRLFENKGKVALLVAGYSAMDTRSATQVISDYDKYTEELAGQEVIISAEDPTDIKISQPIEKSSQEGY
ncbi:hypothetical protein COV93_04465 [Candidatus Woesearchaeota archaeon CG11_big_fil_rev_8_21_14_0_20_43_8]|nr:MAG: hypothetical protein COV93_04465 [Candidatus Woesearchaeota archaeon CG11_big_fil_rev_8_21_14_0_20_43_8]PIO05268.1 MAG: hypothetical protein COT47_05485 [Candidatus Woesearchaeota archaeon CG08_land_8_20_14_0_20_43_7]